tara:strand:- start:211 stop:498 length:288 start_codon:yes stop_codon:yes gene_type:complete
MEIEQIKNCSYNPERQILEFDYSLDGDPQYTYRNILIEREKFEDYFSFPTGTSWDDDEGYYEVDIDLQLDDSLLIEALSYYLDINDDYKNELIKE